MSVQATFDGEDRGVVATNRGWSEFTGWLDSLDEDDYPALRHLAHHGWHDDVRALATELGTALEDEAPGDDQASVGRGLLALMEDSLARTGDDEETEALVTS